jgi:hypothetical protein
VNVKKAGFPELEPGFFIGASFFISAVRRDFFASWGRLYSERRELTCQPFIIF